MAFASLAVALVLRPTMALAMAGGMGGASKVPVAPIKRKEALSLFGLFFALFGGLALLHAAEIAITTLYPWKVKEFAEEVCHRRLRRRHRRRLLSSYTENRIFYTNDSFLLYSSLRLIICCFRRKKVAKQEHLKS
jgi:hypothetical protein